MGWLLDGETDFPLIRLTGISFVRSVNGGNVTNIVSPAVMVTTTSDKLKVVPSAFFTVKLSIDLLDESGGGFELLFVQENKRPAAMQPQKK